MKIHHYIKKHIQKHKRKYTYGLCAACGLCVIKIIMIIGVSISTIHFVNKSSAHNETINMMQNMETHQTLKQMFANMNNSVDIFNSMQRLDPVLRTFCENMIKMMEKKYDPRNTINDLNILHSIYHEEIVQILNESIENKTGTDKENFKMIQEIFVKTDKLYHNIKQ